MILSQFLSLADLPKTQVFCIYEVLEVVIVYKYKNFMVITLKVMLP